MAFGPAAGQAFHITNDEPISPFDFLRKVWYEYNGYQAAFILVIPYFLAFSIACINDAIAYVRGVRAEGLTRHNVRYATSRRVVSIEKARRVLGYRPIVGLEEGIKRSVQVSLYY